MSKIDSSLRRNYILETNMQLMLYRTCLIIVATGLLSVQGCDNGSPHDLKNESCFSSVIVKREQIGENQLYKFKEIDFVDCEKKCELIYTLNGWQLIESVNYKQTGKWNLGYHYFCRLNNNVQVKELSYVDTLLQSKKWSSNFLLNIALGDILSRLSAINDESKNALLLKCGKLDLDECLFQYTEFGIPAVNNAKYVQFWNMDESKHQRVKITFDEGLFTQDFNKTNDSIVTVRSVYFSNESNDSIVTLDYYSGTNK